MRKSSIEQNVLKSKICRLFMFLMISLDTKFRRLIPHARFVHLSTVCCVVFYCALCCCSYFLMKTKRFYRMYHHLQGKCNSCAKVFCCAVHRRQHESDVHKKNMVNNRRPISPFKNHIRLPNAIIHPSIVDNVYNEAKGEHDKIRLTRKRKHSNNSPLLPSTTKVINYNATRKILVPVYRYTQAKKPCPLQTIKEEALNVNEQKQLKNSTQTIQECTPTQNSNTTITFMKLDTNHSFTSSTPIAVQGIDSPDVLMQEIYETPPTLVETTPSYSDWDENNPHDSSTGRELVIVNPVATTSQPQVEERFRPSTKNSYEEYVDDQMSRIYVKEQNQSYFTPTDDIDSRIGILSTVTSVCNRVFTWAASNLADNIQYDNSSATDWKSPYCKKRKLVAIRQSKINARPSYRDELN